MKKIILGLTVAATSVWFFQSGYAQSLRVAGAELLQQADQNASSPGVSPIRRINRGTRSDSNNISQDLTNTNPASDTNDYRTIDGSDNNLANPEMGAAHHQLRRMFDPDYSDGISTLAGASRPGSRAISNALSHQDQSRLNEHDVSDFIWQWGQFLDHDIDLTDGVDPPENADIAVPNGDTYFDVDGTGTTVLSFNRSIYDTATGDSQNNPRQQLNEITAWIDASNVYGSDITRANALRTLDGSGQLKTSSGNLLPFNTEGLANAGGDSPDLFLAGDVRANEQAGLTAMHTLFVREHNRLTVEIAAQDNLLTGEEIYQRARKIVGAQMQAITYNEFLPTLLGANALRPYQGYNENIDARIANAFSTAAYRLGHSMLSPQLLRLDDQGNEIPFGHLSLRDAFFAPHRIIDEGGIAPILRGLAIQHSQKIDSYIIDDVRNFLFGQPGQGGFDLASLNIQRGRDHGLPSYNAARRALGLRPARRFADVSSDPDIQSKLQSVYASTNDIDLWVGGLAEDHLGEALIGELFFHILKRQFEALRDGDRFWYQISLNAAELTDIENTKLADIIRRNTGIADEISDDAFHTNFVCSAPPANSATGLLPNDSTSDSTPEYSWSPLSDASSYKVYIADATGNAPVVISMSEEDANCRSGTCSISPDTALNVGNYIFWLQSANSCGNSAWQSVGFERSCTASPPAPGELLAPAGRIRERRPVYRWQHNSETTWYNLWVSTNGNDQPFERRWVSYTEAGCNDDGICEYQTNVTTPRGQHTWWLLGFNSCGLSAWSSGVNFSTP